MKYCDDTCLILNGLASSLKLMEDLQEEIMQERKPHRRFCAWDCGGLRYIKILKHIVSHAMYVREQENHPEEMNFHYNLKYRCSHLKNGRFILLVQLSPQGRKLVRAISSP